MSKQRRRRFPYNPIKGTIALPADVSDLGQIDWYQPPTAKQLREKYIELTSTMDAERAARAIAIGLLIAADKSRERKDDGQRTTC